MEDGNNQIPLTTTVEPLYTIDENGNLIELPMKFEHRKEEVWTAEMRSIDYRRNLINQLRYAFQIDRVKNDLL